MMFCVEAANSEGLSESACVLVFSFVTVFCSCIRADSASAFTRAMVSSAMLSAEFFALAVNSSFNVFCKLVIAATASASTWFTYS